MTEEEKIATVVSVPNFGKIDETQKKPRYILVRAKSVWPVALQFWALTQTWVNGGMYSEEVGDIAKGEFFLALKLSKGAPNNATIKHMFDGVNIEYRWIEKPAIEKLLAYPKENKDAENFGKIGHGYNEHRLGFRRPGWATCLPKDWWDDDDE